MATLEQPAFWNADTLALAKTVPTHTAFAALVTRLAPDRAAAELLARHMAACVLGDVDAASTVILYNGRQSGKRTYAWLLHRLMWLLGRPCHLEKGNDTLAVSMNGRQLLVATSTLPPRWVQTDPSKVVIHANADFPSPSSTTSTTASLSTSTTAYSGSSIGSIGSIGSSNTSSSNSSSSNLLDASKPYVLASAVATAPRHEIISFLAQFVPARDTVRPQYHTPPAGPSASASLTPPSSIAAATAAAAATTMSSSSTMTAGLPMASHRHSAPYSLSGSSSSASSSASSSSYHHHTHTHHHHTHNIHSHLGHHAHPHAHPSHSHSHGHGPSRHRSLAVPAAI